MYEGFHAEKGDDRRDVMRFEMVAYVACIPSAKESEKNEIASSREGRTSASIDSYLR